MFTVLFRTRNSNNSSIMTQACPPPARRLAGGSGTWNTEAMEYRAVIREKCIVIFFLAIHYSNIPIVITSIRSKHLTDGSKLDEWKSG